MIERHILTIPIEKIKLLALISYDYTCSSDTIVGFNHPNFHFHTPYFGISIPSVYWWELADDFQTPRNSIFLGVSHALLAHR